MLAAGLGQGLEAPSKGQVLSLHLLDHGETVGYTVASGAREGSSYLPSAMKICLHFIS